jgi:hypothetical protein
MRVALLAGVLVVNLFTAFYQVGWFNLSSAAQDSTQASLGQLSAMEDTVPPPPSFP